ncbi:hypothetical protein LZ24_00121 [Desulfobotulus alkaliphilus]|uniref:Uncharacterized protein n=1 Tax=Desulfobotulus alkaliphilus TaxID=622671 RepID=A0A562S7F1_9BACT|nr:hypothetical protein LZ24_00121 [Desulfobotulus alkaliphilus]
MHETPENDRLLLCMKSFFVTVSTVDSEIPILQLQELRTAARHPGYLQVTLQSFRIRDSKACAKEAANCLTRHKGSVMKPAMVIKKLILPVAGSFCRFRTGQEAPE